MGRSLGRSKILQDTCQKLPNYHCCKKYNHHHHHFKDPGIKVNIIIGLLLMSSLNSNIIQMTSAAALAYRTNVIESINSPKIIEDNSLQDVNVRREEIKNFNGSEEDEQLLRTDVKSDESLMIVKRASNPSSNRKINSLMSFGQLVILAQEEAKCLQGYGGQRNRTGIGSASASFDEENYIPFFCTRGSSEFAQCEQCRNLTSRARTPEECSDFCEKRDEFCEAMCISINQAVTQGAEDLDKAHNSRLSQDNNFNNKNVNNQKQNNYNGERFRHNRILFFNTSLEDNNNSSELNNKSTPSLLFPEDDNSSTLPFSLESPQIFCEGVNRPENPLKSPSESYHAISIEETADGNKNHYVFLKWNIKYQEGGGGGWMSGNKNSSLEYTNKDDKKENSSMESIPLVFVIEQFSNSSPKWEAVGKTVYGLQMLNVTYASDTYKWRITAVGPNGSLDEVTSLEYVTLDGYVKPGPPKKIYVVQTTVNNSLVNVLIGWDPPQEKACFYKIKLESHEGTGKHFRIKDEPLGVHRYWFDSLHFGTQYSVLITSRDASWDSESNLTRLDFKTPTCLESYNYRFDKCVPPPPRDIRNKFIQESSDNGKNVIVLSWKPPQNTSVTNRILKYMITISRLSFKNSNGGGIGNNAVGGSGSGNVKHINLNLNSSFSYLNFNGSSFNPEKHVRHFAYNTTALPPYEVPGNTTSIQLTNLPVDSQYTVMITAFSIRGASRPAEHHLFVKPPTVEHIVSPISNWLYLTIPVSIMMLILLACNLGRIYLHKRQVKLARDQYFQSMEERDSMAADWSIVPLTEETSTWKLFDDNFPKDRWEIMYENLVMGEVIGQGAFGVVRRAKIPRKKLQSSTLKYLDKNTSHLANEKTEADSETLAVKMLKVSATREDREQLIKEIMTMQNLGFHPQIVGLIGACTKGRSLCLVLEYCPGGDLLTFIRKVRAKYWPTLGLSSSDPKKSASLSSIMSREDSTLSATGGTRSSGSGGCLRPDSKSNPEGEGSIDNSPINYADIEGFSDYSSSSPERTLQGTQQNPSENTGTSKKKATIIDPCRSPSQGSSRSGGEMDEEDEFRPIDEKDVLSYARQIAMGMDYLEKNRIVHRDLACRNCLLMGDYKQVKISDFGLSRDIYTWNVYHQKSNGKLPIKWMAIESIFTHVFTTKSDVWSYGILLWELVTLGGTPYPGLGNTELFHLLKSGYRMERPDNCSEELYAVMKKCWRTSPAARPNFTELRHHVETMMEAAEPNLYLSLMADIPSDYFRLSSRSDLLQMNPDMTTTDGSICGGGGSGSRGYHNSIGGNSSRYGQDTNSNKKYAGYHNTNSNINTSSNNRNSFSSSTSGPMDMSRVTYTSSETSGKSYSRSNSNTSGPSRTGSCSGGSSLKKFSLNNVPQNKRGNAEKLRIHTNGNNIVGANYNSPLSESSHNQNHHQHNNNINDESEATTDNPSTMSAGLPRSRSENGMGNCTLNTNNIITIAETANSEPHNNINFVPEDNTEEDEDQYQIAIRGGDDSINNSERLSPFKEKDYNPELHSRRVEMSHEISPTTNTGASFNLPYPFRHVNNMTIIENKTYDLADGN